ncbi:MAG: SPW repeat protein [Planctomycetes bacterium]|nr:SPW repeat protein [Planctomycetota bacterium]
MMPLVISGFIALLVLALVLVGYRWHRPLPGDSRQGGGRATDADVPGGPPGELGSTWWGRNLGIQRSIGLLLTVGGLWHAASPWISRYSNVTAAAASNVASGLVLAAVGAALAALRGGAGLTWAAGAIGVWVLIAPAVLGFGGPGLPANEAIWGGPITIVLAVLAGLDRRLGRDQGPPPIGTPS